MPDVDHSRRAFEDTVKTVLTTFGVFTGFVIKAAIDQIAFPPSQSWWDTLDLLKDPHLFVCIATVALLLRFIIGSAVHLNLCYVVEPRSVKPVMLFKDVAFLIVFGLLAVFMIKAGDNVASFATRAAVFISVGLLWSIVDAFVRRGQTGGEQSLFSKAWTGIDLAQLVAIAIVLWLVHDTWWQAFALAIAFAAALFWDMKIVLAATKPAPA